jgi:flagellar basal-body rod modification protein FlgD
MAQFTALEQMSNLNGTMSFAGASSLIGKTVTLNDIDAMGNQYWGIVKSVRKDGSSIKLNVAVEDNGEILTKEFDYSDITEVENS